MLIFVTGFWFCGIFFLNGKKTGKKWYKSGTFLVRFGALRDFEYLQLLVLIPGLIKRKFDIFITYRTFNP